jgi:hypothetical protein
MSCVLLLLPLASGALITNILIDASNLQLRLGEPSSAVSKSDLWALEMPGLRKRLDAVTHALSPSEEVRTTAVFDGRAFDNLYVGESWDCPPFSAESGPVGVSFTLERESADDTIVMLAQELGLAAGAPRADDVTSGNARSTLEQELTQPAKPVFAATLLKSAAGKGKRSKREAFLRTCGLLKMGDTVHLPAFDESMQMRSLSLVRGLHALERGIIRFQRLSSPSTMVITDDRGLRRRCFALANPPVVFGRNQLYNWMERVEPFTKDEDEEAARTLGLVD